MGFDEMYSNLREGVVRAVVDVGPQPDEIVRLQMALDAAEAEIERLRQALDKAAGRLGYLSTVLSHSNKPNNAKGALEWSEETRAALGR